MTPDYETDAQLEEARVGLAGMGYWYFPIEIELVHNLDTATLIERIRTSVRERGFRACAGHVVITFTGFVTDPREIYQIPEAVDYYRKLDSDFPELPALLANITEVRLNLPALHLMFLGAVDAVASDPIRRVKYVHVVDPDPILNGAARRILTTATLEGLENWEGRLMAQEFLLAASQRFKRPSG